MMFNVPQFIDVEDKIAGPLTVKQLLWMLGMGAVVLVISLFFDGAAVYGISAPAVLIFVALAFYRPNGQSLALYVMHGFFFLFRPKVMMWQRPTGTGSIGALSQRAVKKPDRPVAEKRANAEDFRRVAEMVDRR